MNQTVKFLMTLIIALAFVVGCKTDEAEDTSSTSSSDSNAGSVSLVAALDSGSNALLGSSANLVTPLYGVNGDDTNLTPSVYKLALVDFWLSKEDGTDVSLMNPDSVNPIYTEERPLILDFSSSSKLKELLKSATIEAGTYTGYKMQFLYIEMVLPTAFHLPSDNTTGNWETDLTNVSSYLDTELTKKFRLYFNATGKYWKRDFVVEMVDQSGEFYWLRRGLENQTGRKNFFIKVDSNDHPVGGAGSTSTIDLFADQDFWGAEADYSTSTSPIIVGSHSTAGGLNVTLENNIVVPATLDQDYALKLAVDINYTMIYDETGTLATGVTGTANVLDLGPTYGTGTPEIYGDGGLHPLMPNFSITFEAATTETTQTAYQVPEACITGGWEEPDQCSTNWCTDNASDEFCTAYGDQ